MFSVFLLLKNKNKKNILKNQKQKKFALIKLKKKNSKQKPSLLLTIMSVAQV